jgi:signal transduction histidine kinase
MLYIGKLYEILENGNNVNWKSDFENTFNELIDNFNDDLLKILCKELDERKSSYLKDLIAGMMFFYKSFVGNDTIKDVDLENLFKIAKLNEAQFSFIIFNFKSQKTAKHIIGKEGEIYRAFLNLVRNGVEAIQRKKNEMNYLKSRDFKGHIKVNVYSDKGYSVIKISDNGSGMPDEALEAFKNRTVYSSKGERGGRGLKAARNIIERNNGTIDVQSELGKGTIFTITLPVAKPDLTLGEKLTHNASSTDL